MSKNRKKELQMLLDAIAAAAGEALDELEEDMALEEAISESAILRDQAARIRNPFGPN